MAGSGTRGIFVSYRREDAGHVAGRLADRLTERFGASNVFIDVDSIEPGIDFAEAIQVAIARCDVLLALIGREWATMVDEGGHRRLDDPDDYVVLELRAALEREIRVIPVLIDGAEVPSQNSLPSPLRPLVRRNAVRLDYETFRSDAAWLVQRLGELLSATETEATPPREALPEHTESVGRTSSAEHAATVEADPSTPSVHNANVDKPRLSLGSRIHRRTFLRWTFGAAAVAAGGAGVWGASRLAGGETPTAPSRLAWSFKTSDEVYSSPKVIDGVVYVGSTDQHLYAIDAVTGKERWQCSTDGSVTSTPAIADGVVYVGCNDDHVYSVDAATGAVRWKFLTGAAMHSSPAVVEGWVYIGCRDHYVYAIDARTGQERWRFKGGDWFNSSPKVAGNTLYIGCRDRNIYALDATTGEKRWSYATESTVDSSAVISGSTMWIGADDHHVYALNAATGQWIWEFMAGSGVVSTPLLVSRVLYVGSDDGNLYALDADTGRMRWRLTTGNGIRSSPASAQGVVYVGSRDFHLYAADAATGELRWRFATQGPIDDSSPTVAGGRIYVGSLDNRVYALYADAG
jgi:outer membrane protein assembly factor BamB